MNYEIIAKSYNELYEEEQLKKLKLIAIHFKTSKNQKLLDIGCGTAISTNFFKCNTFGIDKNLNMLKQGNGNLIKANAENLPFKNNSFDAVISITAIHNFQNPERAINEIIRVKKKNSKIVVTILKKSSKYKKIKSIIYRKFKVTKEIDEEKDTIIFC